ncbi:hypothetical protein HMI55_003400 [Coelomomyces lativittatus]|nr:hypothetical protein HMI55_003400 [Coelomomyces lativittatus]
MISTSSYLSTSTLESISELFKDTTQYPYTPQWKSNPQILKDFLHHVEALNFPFLSPSFPLISPCILRCLDDFEASTRVIGMQALLHVLQHLEPHQFLRTNLNAVYWKSIQHCLEFSSSIPHVELFYFSMKTSFSFLPIQHGKSLSEPYYNDLLDLLKALFNFLQYSDFKKIAEYYPCLLNLLMDVCQSTLGFLSLQFTQRIVHVLCKPIFITFPTPVSSAKWTPTDRDNGIEPSHTDPSPSSYHPLLHACLSTLSQLIPLLFPRLNVSSAEIMTSLCILISHRFESPLLKELKTQLCPFLSQEDLVFLKKQYHHDPNVVVYLS